MHIFLAEDHKKFPHDTIIIALNQNQPNTIIVSRLKCYTFNIYMKNRLGRIRTTYNEQGDYDHDLYFKQQKAVYSREIDFATRVDAITEKQFTLKPLEIGFLSSTALKDEQKFKEIKKIFQDYNRAIIERGGDPVNGLHLKKVVMESMLKFMNLMMLAPDTGTKKTILDIAHHWFIRHLDPKSQKKSAIDLQKQIRQIIVQKQLLPIDLINRELIINKVNDQLYPYKIKARTMYKELDDPRYELESYNTHKLEFMGATLKDDQEKNKQRKWIDTVKFPKIQPLAFSIQEPVQEKKEEENEAGKEQPPVQPVPEGQEVKLDAQGKPIVENQETTDQQPQVDLDFGEPPDPDAQPQEPEQDQKKRGKLDPLLKIFILQRIQKQQKAEIACQKVRQKQINKKNLIYEQDFLSGEYIRNWAKQRARIKTQISKKHQSMRGVENIARGKQNQSGETFLQNDIDRIKVKSTIGECKRDISAIEVPPDKLNSQPGLSLYDRRRVKTEASHKPFSSILSDYSRKEQQNQMLNEIASIKEKFSKYKLYTPMDKLIKGLAPPDREYTEEDDKLVWPNSQMLSNPFIKVAKKKKKKKKK